MKIKKITILVLAAAFCAAAGILVSRAAPIVNSAGTLEVTSLAVSTNQDILNGGSPNESISVGLQSLNGANTNSVTVTAELLQNGTVTAQSSAGPLDILHEQPRILYMGLGNIPAGTYTVAVTARNGDGSVNTSFPNLGSVVLGPSGVSTCVVSTSTPPVTPSSTAAALEILPAA
ncbi:MAG: hypothetical protein KGJ13_05865, partial [Patescibacteria group bacterium]|nr:hypothetical protein [Patescibacteria group bacterium]